ncbi:hypothetical protein WJX81_000928 [Elliptochloris bilobata]|uniref:Uncharacterized protein n=1 Tax=Elliptochloris bilobata TaxID=381761 RepID=A0AAW1QAF3_9CHLO
MALPPPLPGEAQHVAVDPSGGEMTQDQYAAMTPDQQAAYWAQWQYWQQCQQQQWEAQQYAQYACEAQPQQYGQPQMMQYGQYPQQQMGYGMPYGNQMLPDMYYQQQHTQAQQAAMSQHLPMGHPGGPPSAPYPVPQGPPPEGGAPASSFPAMLRHSERRGDHAAAPLYTGLPMGAPLLGGDVAPAQAQPKKPAVPSWLRAEMLKRGLTAGAPAAARAGPGQDSDDEAPAPRAAPRRFAEAPGGSRWAEGGSERGGPRGDGGAEDAAAEARRAHINAEVKRTLTSLLLEVTDAMFEELANEALDEATAQANAASAATHASESAVKSSSGAAVLLTTPGEEKAGPTALPMATSADGAAGAGSGDAEVAAGFIGPEAPEKSATMAPLPFDKGDRVWYRARDDAETPATVEGVDIMHPPPSFCVRLDGADSTRETEAPHLRAMTAGEDPCGAAKPSDSCHPAVTGPDSAPSHPAATRSDPQPQPQPGGRAGKGQEA